MFPYFKNILLITRKINAFSLINNESNVTQNIIHRYARRTFCVCGIENKNYSESINRFNGVHVTLNHAYDSAEAFEQDLLSEYVFCLCWY